MKSTTLLMSCLVLLLISCKNTKENEEKSINKIQKIELPKQKSNDSKKEQPKITLLSKTQFEAFFPEYLGSNKRFNIFVYPGEPMATASYGSFQNSYNFSVFDAIKDNSIIKNFEMSYNAKQNAPEGTEYVLKERDGYKTIAFLQPNIKRYNIQFVFNNRFNIVLEGPEHSDILWSYIKKEDLQKLDTY